METGESREKGTERKWELNRQEDKRKKRGTRTDLTNRLRSLAVFLPLEAILALSLVYTQFCDCSLNST